MTGDTIRIEKETIVQIEEQKNEPDSSENDPIIEPEKNNNKKTLIIIISVLIVIIAVCIVFLILNNKPKDRYEIVEESSSFDFAGFGELKGEEEEYTFEVTDELTLGDVLVSIDDVVKVDEELYTYTETEFGDPEVTPVITDISGWVFLADDTSVSVVEKVSTTAEIPSGDSVPVVNSCAGVVVSTDAGDVYQTAFVKSVGDPDGEGTILAGVEIINTDISIRNGDMAKIYFSTSFTGEQDCEEWTFSSDSGIGWTKDLDKILSTSNYSNRYISLNMKEFEKELPVASIPSEEEYEFVSVTREVDAGDYVNAGDNLFEHKYKPFTIEEKSFLSEVDGIVNEIVEKVDSLLMRIGDSSTTYMQFLIPEEYIGKIAINQEIEMEIGDVEIVSKIADIDDEDEDNVLGIVENANFEDFPFETEVNLSLSIEGEDIILIPKKYVTDGKVNLVVGDKVEKTSITYKEYNKTHYQVLSGLEEGDIVEE